MRVVVRRTILVMVAILLCWSCSDSQDETIIDGDLDATEEELDGDSPGELESSEGVGLTYHNCNEEFDPWAVEARQYTIAPYPINPTTSEITIQWEALDDAPSFILWGKDGNLDTVDCAPQPQRIEIESDEIDEEHDGWLYRVTLQGLDSQARYNYTIPNAQIPATMVENTWSVPVVYENFEGGSFVSAPLPGERFSMMIVGDNQGLPNMHYNVIQHMRNHIADLMLHLGDIVHNGVIAQYRGSYFLLSSPVLTKMASVHIAGNHEGTGESIPYDAFFNVPDAGVVTIDGQGQHPGKRAFTYDYGNVRFFVLDSEKDMGEGSVQLAWLDERLRKTVTEDSDIRFLFCAWHRPTYSWGDGRHESPKEAIHEVMKRWQVDMVLTGHDHDYQRFDQDNIPYMVTGGAGALLTAIVPDTALPGDNLVVGETVLHIVLADFGPDEAEFKVFDSETDMLIDQFSIQAKDRSKR